MKRELIDKQDAIDTVYKSVVGKPILTGYRDLIIALKELPSAQPTIYGYNIEHLELIARILQKENLPPEKVAEMLTDIERIVAIVCDEFEENLRKAIEQCVI